ncbi:ABC transporter substrate-binding protein [Dethiothermospora halolimnae]|uniref:ABC transporter substrate-binding protein n=1 Tax=Dethiothermospora halolimnae TaxID=3114390 RepID=UPI003CCC0C1B
MKKGATLLILIFTLMALIGCSQEKNEKVNKKKIDDSQEITIALWGLDMRDGGITAPIGSYTGLFQIKNDIKITYDVINATSYEEYIEKLNTRLYTNNGPDLIFFSRGRSPKLYTDKGVGIDVNERLENIDKIYDGLKRDKMYYVPIGIFKPGMILNKGLLEELNIEEPDVNWTIKGYLNIKKQWLKDNPIEFNIIEYEDIVTKPLYNLDIIDGSNKKVNLNSSKVRNFLVSAKNKIFSEDYILNEDYDYYYNMSLNIGSNEYLGQFEKIDNNQQNILRILRGPNILKLKDQELKNDKFLILPNVYDGDITTFGFMVNKKGKNIDLALKYIDGLLNDGNQKKIYEDQLYYYYPVNQEVEKEVVKIDKEKGVNERFIKMREVILDKLKNEKIDYMGEERKIEIMYKNIEKDLFYLIFTDKEYNEKELEGELKKLEDKYNLILNE